MKNLAKSIGESLRHRLIREVVLIRQFACGIQLRFVFDTSYSGQTDRTSIFYSYWPHLNSMWMHGTEVPTHLNKAEDSTGAMTILMSDTNRHDSNAYPAGNPINTSHYDYNALSWSWSGDIGWPGWTAYVSQGMNNCYIDGHVAWAPRNKIISSKYFSTYGYYYFAWTE